ncbi:toxin ParE1 [Polymorphobacter glacialis]|uniref:Toxin n=1 Tax=Sandarakinorhabdus glacialis TaxID=1614636 RepID=A0A917A1R3_9SPHN|nr:type II toxin-antitoxin system RelE/ParE family toxin [Polymorphobacter glacialis]GGE22751.1 toxin ParE1 [Polymorphobacter glacialis]
MTRYILSPLARADLDNIWEHTTKRWDDDQAETYLRMIQAAIDAVAANPRLGRLYDKVRAGYRRYRAGSHLIMYRETSDAIDIVRVLHEKMDIGSHLPDLS